MISDSQAFSGFSVRDVDEARRFYAETLGLTVTPVPDMGPLMRVRLGSGADVLVYGKDDHQPATFTVLNFPVSDLEAEVDRLTAAGVPFERYEGFSPDEKGIHRGQGPDIAWFRDPSGNILSVIQE
jgi:catechol 2,3-dioxygenase-like lactoylglutathione lyase family enzyme